MNAAERTVKLAAAIERFRFAYTSEDELQQGIAAALADDYMVEREVRLSSRSRVDLLVDGDLVVEVKVAGAADALVRQVSRYCIAPGVAGLVVVSTRVRHMDMPATINNKPVAVVSLAGAGL